MLSYKRKGRRNFAKFHNKVKLAGSSICKPLIKLYKLSLLSIEYGKVTAEELESARVSLKRILRKRGKIYCRAYAYLPVNERALGVRMGKGKADKIKTYVCPVKPGKILYEISGVSLNKGRRVLMLAAKKLSVKTKISNIFIY